MKTLFAAASLRGGSQIPRILSATADYSCEDLRRDFAISVDPDEIFGRTAIVSCDRTAFCSALLQLDGLASRLVLCPPDFDFKMIDWLVGETGATHLVTDGRENRLDDRLKIVRMASASRAPPAPPDASRATEWILFTSGTSGTPKLVSHTLETLAGAIDPASGENAVVWGTFYDIRRYGGLQILLRALVGGGSLVLADEAPIADYIERLRRAKATHITGTPSHWRSALMTPAIDDISPRYVRLSGENVDQAVLDALQARFPAAAIGHAFASTEAGVAFEVRDGKAGFPASYLDKDGDVALKLVDGCLRVRSRRCATRYVNAMAQDLADAEGFVDTGDMIEIRDGRCFFLGRRGGIINIGGLKVHPEEIEAVINRHPGVAACLVRARANPILGSIVSAEIVAAPTNVADRAPDDLEAEIKLHCREFLAPYKIPATIRIVESLKLSAAGKLARHG